MATKPLSTAHESAPTKLNRAEVIGLLVWTSPVTVYAVLALASLAGEG